MTETPMVVIRFKDADTDEALKQEIERRARELSEEFPEITRFEIHLEPAGLDFTAHGHVTGRSIDVATHGQGPELRIATDQLFHRLVRQLRRVHDKRIFLRRREAQKSSPKK